MDYVQDILNQLLDQLERRKTSEKPLAMFTEKKYPEYREPFSDCHEEINTAILQLVSWGILQAKKDVQGYYTKLTMDLAQCPQAYRLTGRISKQEIQEKQKALLKKAQEQGNELVCRVSKSFLSELEQGRFPGYGIRQDCEKLCDILKALDKITELKTETYVRNFSELVFQDSKRFQALQTSIAHILMDFTPGALDEENILEQYELYPNPTYVYFKGGWNFYAGQQLFSVSVLPGGMGLPITALDKITKIELTCKRVISVENLTTYHDTPETDAAVLYLGGFPNQVRVRFLKKLYQSEPNAQYFHWGDLDPCGFLILENLREKTGIPFEPMQMDLAALKQCFEKGHYRNLNKQDLKVMERPVLAKYKDVLSFMKEHDCKIEQECFEAMKLER